MLTRREVEVGKLEHAEIPVDKEVVRLNVAVDEALVVHVTESLRSMQEKAEKQRQKKKRGKQQEDKKTKALTKK